MIFSVNKYETQNYDLILSDENFEIRFYPSSLKAKVASGKSANGNFYKLFQFISGNNSKEEKIEMTTPVTMLPDQGQMVMQFYLPSRFDLASAPLPADGSVEIASIDEGYFAVIQYSGFASDKNFVKHAAILKNSLDQAEIEIKGPAIKATYNGPFTLPHLRRNEAMFLVNWSNK